MLRPLAAVLVMATAVAAAPVPKGESEAQRIEKLFGTPVDPDKDCAIKLDRTALVVTIPDTPHALTDERHNAPRVVRAVRGDFAARVKVACRLPPGPAPGCVPCSAGLLAYRDDGTFARYEVIRLVHGPVGQLMGQNFTDGKACGGIGMADNRADPAAVLWLRLIRRGVDLEYAVSYDAGAVWNTYGQSQWAGLGADLKVGVFAAHEGRAGFTATFEDFTVEPLTEPKK